MLKLAKQYNIEVFWFYGEAGHAKGLVDAMSSFGCKKVLSTAGHVHEYDYSFVTS